MNQKKSPDPKKKTSSAEQNLGTVPEQTGSVSPVSGESSVPNSVEGPGSAPRETAADEVSQLRQELAAAQEALSRAQADLAEATDAKLRALAELENFRRRTARQLEEERRYALFPLVRDLLPVVDNLRRALQSGETTQDMAGLLAGVKLVAKQLQDVLQRHHCVEIEALGAHFDPNLHEAISQVTTKEHPAGVVVEVAQPGFRLHDRVVRPSLVVVAAGPAESAPSSGQDDHPPDGQDKGSGSSPSAPSEDAQSTPPPNPG